MSQENNERKITYSGNWIEFENISYSDHNGKNRTWEAVKRKQTAGAAAIIAILKPSNKITLVRQFRPPAGGFVLNFLLD